MGVTDLGFCARNIWKIVFLEKLRILYGENYILYDILLYNKKSSPDFLLKKEDAQ